MDRPLSDYRPFGPFTQNTEASKPVLRIITEQRPDESEIASMIDDTNISHTSGSSIVRNLEINQRNRGNYDTIIDISGLSHEQYMELDSVIQNIGGNNAEAFFECM